MELPAYIDKGAWDGFVEMRKKIKKPLTDRAMMLTINKLEQLMMMGQDPNKVLDQSTMSCWQGVFPVREENGLQTSSFRGRTTRDFAAERQEQKSERNARLYNRINKSPGGNHSQNLIGTGNGNMDNETIQVPKVETE